MTPARTGEITAGRITFESTASTCTAPAPAATSEAPMRPPNSACDELDGSPSRQVTRFHMIAPSRPAKITTGEILVSSTSPLEIVLATSTERKAPTTLRIPAIRTAGFGLCAAVGLEGALGGAVARET